MNEREVLTKEQLESLRYIGHCLPHSRKAELDAIVNDILGQAEQAERERDEALAADDMARAYLSGCIEMVDRACDRMGVPRTSLGILTWWHRSDLAAENFVAAEARCAKLREAVQDALNALGPNAPTCCGCDAEWSFAIERLRAALAALRDEPAGDSRTEGKK